jgi:RNAse (barnase) inhibitor barstar
MPKAPSNKVGLYVYIDREVAMEIKRLASLKYGRLWGVLSYEVEQALRAWIAQHAHDAHKNMEVNPEPKAVKVFSQVKKYLEERFGYAAIIPGQQIPRQHILTAIAAVRGPDNRTIRKWFDAFIRFKLLRHVGGEVYEVL